MQRVLFLWLILFSIYPDLYAQNDRSNQSDFALTKKFDEMMSADPITRYDSLAPAFKVDLKRALLASPDLTFDSLASRIKMVKSDNEKLRLYSWDERSGGSWHQMMVIAQFITDNQEVAIQEISGNEGETGAFTDAVVYEIHELVIEDKTHYLTIGWGTHGSGHHHTIVQIFKIERDRLITCTDCFASNNNLVVEAPRINKIELAYNPKSMEITHNEFVMDSSIGFYKATGNIVTWKFRNGKFVKE